MANGLLITQLIWLRPGREAAFAAYEDAVLPLLAKHGGELLLRARPEEGTLAGDAVEPPDEVHVVRFASEAGLRSFNEDGERVKLLPVKDAAVRASLVLRGTIPPAE